MKRFDASPGATQHVDRPAMGPSDVPSLSHSDAADDLDGSLFSTGAFLEPLTRSAYYGFVVIGCLFLAFSMFVAALELTTMPGRWTFARRAIAISFAFIFAHVFFESRSARRLSRVRWAIFAISVIDVAICMAYLIRDPIGAAIFAAMVLQAGLWLMLAKALVTTRGGRLARAAFLWRLLAALGAWSPVIPFLAAF